MLEVTTRVAEALYHSGCLKFGTFTIKSGNASPYYVDLSCLLSSPKGLSEISKIAAKAIREIMTLERVDRLATIELKGALILPIVACQLNLPCIIVRKGEKEYGVTGRIAGAEIAKGDRILFFDDVVSEGLSKLEGIRPLESLGAVVKHLLVVVDRQQGGKENLEALGYEVHALTRISELVNHLFRSRHIAEEQANAVLNYVART